MDEVQLELFSDESCAGLEDNSGAYDEETRKVAIDGSFELRCYVSLRSTIAEVLSQLAKDFIESFTARIEYATYEDNRFDQNSAKLRKNKTMGFNLARRAFLRLEGHPFVMYQDYLTALEVARVTSL